jgi:hypothetical protein
MGEQDRNLDEALDGLDQGKRATLMRLAKGSAFTVPVVAAFLMQGISIQPAHAAAGSSANHTKGTPSDIRLKRDVARIGTHPSGCGIYRFKYLWSDTCYVGAIAQDVLEHVPGAVVRGPGDFLAVDYGALGMEMQRQDAQAS